MNSSIYIDGISLYVLILFVLLLFVIGIISIAGWMASDDRNNTAQKELESEREKNRILSEYVQRKRFLKSQDEIEEWRKKDV